jgi:hypothetical protein
MMSFTSDFLARPVYCDRVGRIVHTLFHTAWRLTRLVVRLLSIEQASALLIALGEVTKHSSVVISLLHLWRSTYGFDGAKMDWALGNFEARQRIPAEDALSDRVTADRRLRELLAQI